MNPLYHCRSPVSDNQQMPIRKTVLWSFLICGLFGCVELPGYTECTTRADCPGNFCVEHECRDEPAGDGAVTDGASVTDVSVARMDASAPQPDMLAPTPDASPPPPDATAPTPDLAVPTADMSRPDMSRPDADAAGPADLAPPLSDATAPADATGPADQGPIGEDRPGDAAPDALPDGPPPCVALDEVCDGLDSDCDGEVDDGAPCPPHETCVEAACTCTEGAVRLAGGADEREGRVEFCHGGLWGTVCDDAWDDLDARVVCGELGFPGHAEGVSGGAFGPGPDPIWLSELACTGDEPSLAACPQRPVGTSACGHDQDAAARCVPRPETCNGEDDDGDGAIDGEGVCDGFCRDRERFPLDVFCADFADNRLPADMVPGGLFGRDDLAPGITGGAYGDGAAQGNGGHGLLLARTFDFDGGFALSYLWKDGFGTAALGVFTDTRLPFGRLGTGYALSTTRTGAVLQASVLALPGGEVLATQAGEMLDHATPIVARRAPDDTWRITIGQGGASAGSADARPLRSFRSVSLFTSPDGANPGPRLDHALVEIDPDGDGQTLPSDLCPYWASGRDDLDGDGRGDVCDFDGRMLLLPALSSPAGLQLLDPATFIRRRLGPVPEGATGIVGSPDQPLIAFERDGAIFTARSDGTNVVEVVAQGAAPSWRLGGRLIYHSTDFTQAFERRADGGVSNLGLRPEIGQTLRVVTDVSGRHLGVFIYDGTGPVSAEIIRADGNRTGVDAFPAALAAAGFRPVEPSPSPDRFLACNDSSCRELAFGGSCQGDLDCGPDQRCAEGLCRGLVETATCGRAGLYTPDGSSFITLSPDGQPDAMALCASDGDDAPLPLWDFVRAVPGSRPTWVVPEGLPAQFDDDRDGIDDAQDVCPGRPNWNPHQAPAAQPDAGGPMGLAWTGSRFALLTDAGARGFLYDAAGSPAGTFETFATPDVAAGLTLVWTGALVAGGRLDAGAAGVQDKRWNALGEPLDARRLNGNAACEAAPHGFKSAGGAGAHGLLWYSRAGNGDTYLCGANRSAYTVVDLQAAPAGAEDHAVARDGRGGFVAAWRLGDAAQAHFRVARFDADMQFLQGPLTLCDVPGDCVAAGNAGLPSPDRLVRKTAGGFLLVDHDTASWVLADDLTVIERTAHRPAPDLQTLDALWADDRMYVLARGPGGLTLQAFDAQGLPMGDAWPLTFAPEPGEGRLAWDGSHLAVAHGRDPVLFSTGVDCQ